MPAFPIEIRRKIVDRIVNLFGTQEILGNLLEIDQSAISQWKKRGIVPAERQFQILTLSSTMAAEGKMDREIVPNDFFYLPDGEDCLAA